MLKYSNKPKQIESMLTYKFKQRHLSAKVPISPNIALHGEEIDHSKKMY